MTTFTASQAVNLSVNGLQEFDIIGLGNIVLANGVEVKFHQGVITVDVKSSFADLNFVTPSGTITSLEVDKNGSLAYKFTFHPTLSVSTLATALATSNASPVLNAVFGGTNSITGSALADVLYGFGGADTIKGNGGADRLVGGVGRDILNGGAGPDTFDFNAKAESTVANFDTIQLFSSAQHDKVDLRTIDATTGGINNAFLFAGAQTFAAFNATHNGGAVRAVAGVVQVDIDGNNTVDMAIVTPGVMLHGGDFIL